MGGVHVRYMTELTALPKSTTVRCLGGRIQDHGRIDCQVTYNRFQQESMEETDIIWIPSSDS